MRQPKRRRGRVSGSICSPSYWSRQPSGSYGILPARPIRGLCGRHRPGPSDYCSITWAYSFLRGGPVNASKPSFKKARTINQSGLSALGPTQRLVTSDAFVSQLSTAFEKSATSIGCRLVMMLPSVTTGRSLTIPPALVRSV